MDLQPVTRRTVSDDVFEQLAAQILGGRLAAGEPLPSERTLTDAFGVNRQAVREALQRLAQAGLVEIQQGGATRATDFRRTAGLDLLPSLLVGPAGVDPAVARSVMEMRACIGPDAARLAALRAPTPVAARLAAIAADMAGLADDDLAALGERNWAFWDAVIDAADNVAYRLAFNSLRDGALRLGDLLPLLLGNELRDRRGHLAIADAVARGDAPAAERAARRLLVKGSATVAQLLVDGARP